MRFSFASLVVLSLSFLTVVEELSATGSIQKFLISTAVCELIEPEGEREGDFPTVLTNGFDCKGLNLRYQPSFQEPNYDISRWVETKLQIRFCCFIL